MSAANQSARGSRTRTRRTSTAFANHAATVDDAVRGLAELLREEGAAPRARPVRVLCPGAIWHRRWGYFDGPRA
eukprot:4224676-Prymnesium_polylepis.1